MYARTRRNITTECPQFISRLQIHNLCPEYFSFSRVRTEVIRTQCDRCKDGHMGQFNRHNHSTTPNVFVPKRETNVKGT